MKSLIGAQISLEEMTLRARIAPDSVVLQDIVKGIRRGGEKFDGRLVLQILRPKPTPQAVDKLRMALAAVPGVRQAGFPDSKGRILVSFNLEKSTKIGSVEQAAKAAGFELGDPEQSRKSSKFREFSRLYCIS